MTTEPEPQVIGEPDPTPPEPAPEPEHEPTHAPVHEHVFAPDDPAPGQTVGDDTEEEADGGAAT
jgi:hypothetical protein